MRTIIFLIILWVLSVTASFAQLDRPYEPVVIKGEALPHFLNFEISHLYLFRYQSSSDKWEMMPFQFDEVNPKDQDSMYFKPDDSFGRLDEDDELVFLLKDLGDQASALSWLVGADTLRYELRFCDPLDGKHGFAYLYFLPTIPGPIPEPYQMRYDAASDRVHSLNYEVGFNRTGQLADVLIKSGSNTDIFDRLKIRVLGWLLVVPVFLHEDYVEMQYAYAKVGPVRVIRNLYGRFYWKQMHFDEKFTQTSFFYPWNGSFKLVEIPIDDAVDVGAKVDLLRISWDFNRNSTGMKFYSETNRSGAIIDAMPDAIDHACTPDMLNWAMGTGDPGTMLNIFYVPPLGDQIELYYYDNSDGKTADPGLKVDTGDSLSFGDNGFSLQKHIEQYAAAESTLDVVYYNFFLPPNFGPDEASLLCAQLNFPVEITAKLDTFGVSTKISQLNLFSPDQFFLPQNYPNPFNASTAILVNLSRPTKIKLQIFDAMGRLVDTLVNELLPSGRHEFLWHGKDRNGTPLPSGIYFCQAATQGSFSRIKMLLIK
ncbi:MAG: T9SS type A sorting domain-containing protein [candidate division KSB1 bacterium]|nr:T9SS type A sorting domain-containing protein [candidate division KSB1 bacterium]